jgi:hypothetical protein
MKLCNRHLIMASLLMTGLATYCSEKIEEAAPAPLKRTDSFDYYFDSNNLTLFATKSLHKTIKETSNPTTHWGEQRVIRLSSLHKKDTAALEKFGKTEIKDLNSATEFSNALNYSHITLSDEAMQPTNQLMQQERERKCGVSLQECEQKENRLMELAAVIIQKQEKYKQITIDIETRHQDQREDLKVKHSSECKALKEKHSGECTSLYGQQLQETKDKNHQIDNEKAQHTQELKSALLNHKKHINSHNKAYEDQQITAKPINKDIIKTITSINYADIADKIAVALKKESK